MIIDFKKKRMIINQIIMRLSVKKGKNTEGVKKIKKTLSFASKSNKIQNIKHTAFHLGSIYF
jgi:hypothetical protein